MYQARSPATNHRTSVPPNLDYCHPNQDHLHHPKQNPHDSHTQSLLSINQNNTDSTGGSLSSTTTSSYPSTFSSQNSADKIRPHSVAITGSIGDSLASSGDLSSNKNRLFDMRLLSESINGTNQDHVNIVMTEENKGEFLQNTCFILL